MQDLFNILDDKMKNMHKAFMLHMKMKWLSQEKAFSMMLGWQAILAIFSHRMFSVEGANETNCHYSDVMN